MKTVPTAQANIILVLQVQGIALLVFKLAAGEFDPTEDEEGTAGEAEDPSDEDVLDVAYEAAGETGVGLATGVDGV